MGEDALEEKVDSRVGFVVPTATRDVRDPEQEAVLKLRFRQGNILDTPLFNEEFDTDGKPEAFDPEKVVNGRYYYDGRLATLQRGDKLEVEGIKPVVVTVASPENKLIDMRDVYFDHQFGEGEKVVLVGEQRLPMSLTSFRTLVEESRKE